MDSLVNTLNNIIEMIKMPAYSVAVLAVIVGGYYYMAGGQEGKMKAKNWIIGGLVGLMIILLSSSIVGYLQGQVAGF